MRSISREQQRTRPHLKDLSSELRTSGAPANQRINLTIEALRERGDNAPEIITFSPWLVGDRDDLLRSLFDELVTAAVRIDPIDTPEIAERNGDPRRRGQAVDVPATSLSRISNIGRAVHALGFPFARLPATSVRPLYLENRFL
jgi:hypothetical protein